MNTELHYVVSINSEERHLKFEALMESFHPFFNIFGKFYLLHPLDLIHIDDLKALIVETLPPDVSFYIGVCPSGIVVPIRTPDPMPPSEPQH